jgi:hypothetical protein
MSVIASFCPGCQRSVYVAESDGLQCPVCASPLVTTAPENTQRVVRIADNETLFRDVNERIEGSLEESGTGADETSAYVCECGAKDCTRTLALSPREYEQLRSHPAQFMVLRGHEQPDAERVVNDLGRYLVVEKIGPGRVIAEESDPRV